MMTIPPPFYQFPVSTLVAIVPFVERLEKCECVSKTHFIDAFSIHFLIHFDDGETFFV